MNDLPSAEIMQLMAKHATEQAAALFAEMADTFASDPKVAIASGPEALRAFAKAIRGTNAKLYGSGHGGRPS